MKERSEKETEGRRPFRFTAEDFQIEKAPNNYVFYANPLVREWICSIANALLEAQEKKCERVYFLMDVDTKNPWAATFDDVFNTRTHTALLWGVEEISSSNNSEGEK